MNSIGNDNISELHFPAALLRGRCSQLYNCINGVRAVVGSIFTALREPVAYGGELLDPALALSRSVASVQLDGRLQIDPIDGERMEVTIAGDLVDAMIPLAQSRLQVSLVLLLDMD